MDRECISDWNSLKKREQRDEDMGMEILIRELTERESGHRRRTKDSKLTMGELLDENHSRKAKALAKKRDSVLPTNKDLTLNEKMSNSSQRETNAESSGTNSKTTSRE